MRSPAATRLSSGATRSGQRGLALKVRTFFRRMVATYNSGHGQRSATIAVSLVLILGLSPQVWGLCPGMFHSSPRSVSGCRAQPPDLCEAAAAGASATPSAFASNASLGGFAEAGSWGRVQRPAFPARTTVICLFDGSLRAIAVLFLAGERFTPSSPYTAHPAGHRATAGSRRLLVLFPARSLSPL